ncbi:lecithin retinol acyltransferase family protein [Thalassotalea aquiviva]|uniref:lecithin retinol acyltransferase family protein n=1 Tax=Thalassotalea aquiviva TaxID=3242415 RepID=UPI00352B0465
MPLPLLWVGAAVLSAVAVSEINENRKSAEKRRFSSNEVRKRKTQPQSGHSRHHSGVEKFPSEVFSTTTLAQVKPGAIVCCGLGGVLEHTGILVDDATIVELHGSGLIRAVSPMRFLANRSGKEIFVACDSHAKALGNMAIATRAINQIYQYQKYDLFKNNCHRFAWQCISGEPQTLTTFHQLNQLVSTYFDRQIYWDKWQFSP